MLVRDIISEVIARGVGDYAGFTYDRKSASNIEITFPDGKKVTVARQEDAKRLSDEWNAKNRPPSKPKDDKKKDTKDPKALQKFMDENKRIVSIVKNSFKGLIRLWALVEYTQGGPLIEAYQTIQLDLWAKRQQAIASGMSEQEANKIFERESKVAFGQWVASNGLVPATAYAIVKITQGILYMGGKGVGAAADFVRALRGINTATTAASAATGPGLIAGIIKWLLVEGAIWGVTWALSRESVARTLTVWMLDSALANIMEGIADMAKISVSAVGSLSSDKDVSAASRDIQQAMKMRPEQGQASRDVGNQVDMKTAPASGNKSLDALVPQ